MQPGSPQAPLRILHIVPAGPFGGMQRIAALLAREQRARGHDARVLCLYHDEHMERELIRRGVPAGFVGTRRTIVRSLGPFARMVLQARPDIVHLHHGLLWSNAVAPLLKRTPWVGHLHSYPQSASGRERLMFLFESRVCDALIAVSDSVAADGARAFPGARIRRVYNGIEVPEAASARPLALSHPPVFGMAARLAPDKGIWEFLAVAEQIAAVRPDARFVLAGMGPLWDDVQTYAATSPLGGRLSFPGHVEAMEGFWAGVDVALFTAPREPLGLRILEPMARGIPVAAFRTGAGSDELIEDGETGLQARYGDAVGLAMNALTLAEDRALRSRLAAQARRAVEERFSLPAMYAGVSAVYGEVC